MARQWGCRWLRLLQPDARPAITFRDGPITIKAAAKADPQKIGEELARITTANSGKLTPQDVVDAARSTRSALHRHFEWDDAKAAAAHRLSQAREIIAIIRVVDKEADTGRRQVFLSVADRGGVSYRTVEEVRGSADLQRIVLNQADRDLAAWQRRYAEIVDAVGHVEQARAAVQRRREELETRAAA